MKLHADNDWQLTCNLKYTYSIYSHTVLQTYKNILGWRQVEISPPHAEQLLYVCMSTWQQSPRCNQKFSFDNDWKIGSLLTLTMIKWQFTSSLKCGFMTISTQFRNSLRNNYAKEVWLNFKIEWLLQVYCAWRLDWLYVQLELQGK